MHSDMVFQDSTFTNGLTVSSTIIKPLKKPKFKKCKRVDAKEFQYIHKPPKHMLRQIADRCTLVDLNQQAQQSQQQKLASKRGYGCPRKRSCSEFADEQQQPAAKRGRYEPTTGEQPLVGCSSNGLPQR
ncbi:hypothetical protein GGI26_003497 [Coemansia sp. RSA 1358]|nr:hypothetical protein GGI26_003497 [Coemansia sp. RSA 1358]